MANFAEAFAATMKTEGGYVGDPQDPSGETYKGIVRKLSSKWDGWLLVDAAKSHVSFPANLDNDAKLQEKIKTFYEINYWNKIRGNDINNQSIAESIFDFAVHAGPITSIKLAQTSVNAKPDGTFGPVTLKNINADDPRSFLAVFALHKIKRYMNICEKRQDSKQFFYGWVKRTLEAA